jgi:hypothetical protein
MLSTVTLWTLMIWATSPASDRLAVTNIGGFASEKSCREARSKIIFDNYTGEQSWVSRSGRKTHIHIRLITCVPVEQERPSP